MRRREYKPILLTCLNLFELEGWGATKELLMKEEINEFVKKNHPKIQRKYEIEK